MLREEHGMEWTVKPVEIEVIESAMARFSSVECQQVTQMGIVKNNPKELNRYLRDDGNGYPKHSDTSNHSNELLASSLVGDGGASWRLKALKRAKEQASREGVDVDEVVEERWGSFGRLAASVTSLVPASSRAHLHAIEDRRRGSVNCCDGTEMKRRQRLSRGLAKQRRHCLIECVPLPLEVAEEAPLYFKKAIAEAEDEWSQHSVKKLIDTSEKGFRGSVPKGFPYFHVEFGMSSRGFVHVIDDEKRFRSSFGLDVVRGMLKMSGEDAYRIRRCSIEAQKLAVASFARHWEPFDWTKQLE